MKKSGTILVVDDKGSNLLLLKDILTPLGYKVITADSGKLALEILENIKPDLILLDVMMPVMNGLEVCRIIRQKKEIGEIPVVFLTAASNINDRVAGLSAGGNDYIVKPFQNDELFARVDTFIQLSKLKTKEKKQKEKLLESEQKFALAFKTSPYAIIITDLATEKIIDVNEGFTSITGYTFDNVNKKSTIDLQLWVNNEDRKTLVNDLKNNKKIHNREYRFHTRSGEIITGLYSAHLIHFKNRPYIFSSISDITDRKKMEDDLKLSEARMEGLLRITQHDNESVQEFLDYALHEAILLTKSKIGYIYFYNETTKEFTLNTWSKEVMKECTVKNPPSVYQLGKTGIWGEAVRQRKAIVVNDFHSPNKLKKGYPKGHVELKRFLTIPVFSNKKIVAVAGVANKETDYIDADSRQLILLMDTVWKYSERKRSANTLRDSEQKFSSIFTNMASGCCYNEVIYKDKKAIDYLILDINPAYEKILRTERKDVVGKLASELYKSIDIPFWEIYFRVMESGISETFELYFAPAKKYLQITTTGSEKGRFSNIFTDITDRKIAENILLLNEENLIAFNKELSKSAIELEKQKQKYENLFDLGADTLFLIDNKTGQILEANKMAEQMYGFTHEELLNKKNIDLSAEPNETKNVTEKTPVSTEKIIHIPIRWHKKNDGNIFPVEITGRFFEWEGKNVHLAAIRNISDKYKIEEALRESEQKFRAIFENNSSAIAIIEADTTISLVNEAYCNLSGYSKKEVEGMSWTKQIPPGDLERLKEYNRKRLINPADTPNKYEFNFYHKNGEIRRSLVSISMIESSKKIITSFIDITERKLAEEKLIESEQRFRAIFEQAAIGVALLNTKTGQFIRVNQKYCDFVGYTMPEMLQKTFMDLTFHEDIETNISFNEKLISGELKEFSYEKRYVHKNGHIIWGNLNISPLWKPGETQETYYHIAIVENINDRKIAETALQKSEEKYRLITENTIDVIWKMNPLAGNFTYISPSVFKLRGYTPEEVMRQTLNEALTPESAEMIRRIIPVTLAKISRNKGGNKSFLYQVDQPHKNGRIIHTEITTTYLYNEQNEIEIIGISRDISERIKAEEELKESNSKYQFIVENSEDILWTMNPDFTFEYVSPSVYIILGYTVEEHLKQSLTDFMTPESAKMIEDEFRIGMINLQKKEYHKLRNRIEFDVDLIRKDKSKRIARITINIIRDEKFRINKIRGKTSDITEKKQIEIALNESVAHQINQLKQINKLNENLKDKNNELEQLIYITSHDLRSPLVNIQGFSEELNISCKNLINELPQLLIENANTEELNKLTLKEIPEALFYIDQSCAKMNMLIDGLLRVSRLGKLVVNLAPVNMNKLIAGVLLNYEFKIKEKQIIIHYGELPDCMADEDLLNQVISNIIDNAIKFMPEQESKRITISGTSENGNSLYCIEDNGKGICKNYLKNIFLVFQKENNDSPGEGLGLAIAAKIIEKHHGKIWVESVINKGCKFFIKLEQHKVE